MVDRLTPSREAVWPIPARPLARSRSSRLGKWWAWRMWRIIPAVKGCPVPERVPVGKGRAGGQIWHFLVPDQGMAAYTDKAVKEMLPAEMKRIREWRKDFTKRFSAGDCRALERLSAAVDRLWKKHCEDLRQVRRDFADCNGNKRRKDDSEVSARRAYSH